MKKNTTRWACVPKIKSFPKLSKPLIDHDKNVQNVSKYQVSHASKVQLERTNMVQIGSLIHIWKDLFKSHKKLGLHVWLGFLFLELWSFEVSKVSKFGMCLVQEYATLTEVPQWPYQTNKFTSKILA